MKALDVIFRYVLGGRSVGHAVFPAGVQRPPEVENGSSNRRRGRVST